MEQNISIEQVLDQLDHNTVRKTKPSIALSLVLIAAGIALVVLNGKMPGASEGGILSPLAIVTGILLMAWGVVSVFFRKTRYQCVANRQKIAFHEIFFDVKERDRLIRLLKEGQAGELKKLKPAAGDALKLRIAATADGSLCYTQVVTYIPFEFVNANEARSHTPQEAKAILEMVR